MKVKIEINNDDGEKEYIKIRKIVNVLEGLDTNLDQSKLETNNTTVKKYYCNNTSCKKEIAKDVVAFCLHEDNKSRFNGKVYCRDCQKTIGGGG